VAERIEPRTEGFQCFRAIGRRGAPTDCVMLDCERRRALIPSPIDQNR
jgi:hypothetical protein